MTRVLVLAAHPDDEVLGMGGTIAVHSSRGDELHVVCVTDGSSTQYPGDETRRASAWPRRTPSDGIIDWNTRAAYLYDWVRAQTRPYPGAFTYVGDDRLVVWRARPLEEDPGAPSGTVVACGEGALLLEEVEGPAPLPVGVRLG